MAIIFERVKSTKPFPFLRLYSIIFGHSECYCSIECFRRLTTRRLILRGALALFKGNERPPTSCFCSAANTAASEAFTRAHPSSGEAHPIPVITTGGPVKKICPPVVTTGPLVITTGGPVKNICPPVITTGPPVKTTRLDTV